MQKIRFSFFIHPAQPGSQKGLYILAAVIWFIPATLFQTPFNTSRVRFIFVLQILAGSPATRTLFTARLRKGPLLCYLKASPLGLRLAGCGILSKNTR